MNLLGQKQMMLELSSVISVTHLQMTAEKKHNKTRKYFPVPLWCGVTYQVNDNWNMAISTPSLCQQSDGKFMVKISTKWSVTKFDPKSWFLSQYSRKLKPICWRILFFLNDIGG